MSNEVNKINWELVREMSAQYGHIVPNMRFGEFNVCLTAPTLPLAWT